MTADAIRRLSSRALLLLAGAGLAAATCGEARAQAGTFLYALNGGGNVSVYSTNADGTLTSVTTIAAVGSLPTRVAVRADQTFAYVTINGANQVKVIDMATHTVVQTLATGTGPRGVAVSPDGTRVYVANNASGVNTVSVYTADPVSGQLTDTGTTIATGALTQPRMLAFSPDGSRLYIANQGQSGNNGSLSTADTGTNTIVGTLALAGSLLTDIAINPAGTRLYLPSFNSQVYVVDTATNTVVTTLGGAQNPRDIAVSPDGTHFYATSPTLGLINQFDATTNTWLGTLSVGSSPEGIVIGPDGNYAYVPNSNLDHVQSFSIAPGTGLLTSVGTFAAGSVPVSLGLCRSTSGSFASGATFFAGTAGAIGCAGTNPTFNGGTMKFTGAGLTMAAPITLGAGGATFDTNGNSATLSGVIGGNGGLAKAGAGTLTLSGVSTYSGATTVNAGTLAVNGTIASSTVTVNSGGTLAGTGTVGPVTVNGGGTLAPGTPPGILDTGNLALTAGSTLAVEISGTTVGTQYDQVSVTGTVNLGGATLNGVLGFVPSAGQVFTIVDNDGADAVTGTFAGLAEGASVAIGGSTFLVSYVGGTGNDVALSVPFTVTPSAGANGTISPLTPQAVAPGATATFTVTPAIGYAATVGGTCGGTLVGTTYTTNAVTASCTVVASFVASPVTTYTAPSATGTGTITASFTGGGPACTYTVSRFIPLTGDPASPPAGTAPAGITFPHGLFDFTTSGCTPGSTITMTITYPTALLDGTQYWKYGPTPSDPAPHWYVLPATITGNAATFTITDGTLGDDDLTANGTIVDQGGPGSAAAIPTLSEWAMLALALLLGWTGMRRMRTA